MTPPSMNKPAPPAHPGSAHNERKQPATPAQMLAALKQLPRAVRIVGEASPRGIYSLALLSLISAITPVSLVWVGKFIVDAVVAASRHGDLASAAGNRDVQLLVALEFSLAAIQVVVGRVQALVRQRVGERLAAHVNTQILEKAVSLELSQFEDSEFYDRLTRARRDGGYRPLQVVSQGMNLLQNSISVLGYIAALLGVGWWVVPVVLLATLPGFLAEVRFNAEEFRLRNWQSPDSRRMMYTEYVLATDTHAKEVQLFGLGPFFLQQYRRLADKIFDENMRMALRRASWGTLLSLTGTAAFYGCYVVMALEAAHARITLGELTMYALAFRQGQASMQSVLSALGGLYENNLYLTNLFEFLATPSGRTVAASAPPVHVDGAERGIRFENVTFHYPGSTVPALRDISLFLPAGESAALVGSNGAGKTTFIKLLTGLYVPTSGRVLLDGREVVRMDGDELRRRFAIIFQDYNRYQLTLRENVGLGEVTHLSDEPRVHRAIDRGGAAELVGELKEGLEAPLGRWFARGTELSGGQWQKVALSRAFMREDADILVLDEPTATLDPEAEYAVFQRFKELTKGRTSILISHRFATVRLADHIYVLMNGAVVEHGSHADLVAMDGAYARLFRLQAQGYAD